MLVLAQVGADAGQQHGEAEGLGDIVIGAGVEAQDGVGLGGLRGQQDHRALVAVLADDLAGLAAIHVGQVHVEDDEVGAVGLDRLDAGRGGGNLGHRELVMQRELLGQRLAQHVVVIDDDDLLRAAHRAPLCPEVVEIACSGDAEC